MTLDARRRRLKNVLAESSVLTSTHLPGSPAHIEQEIRNLHSILVGDAAALGQRLWNTLVDGTRR
jgi:hypothetical protein